MKLVKLRFSSLRVCPVRTTAQSRTTTQIRTTQITAFLTFEFMRYSQKPRRGGGPHAHIYEDVPIGQFDSFDSRSPGCTQPAFPPTHVHSAHPEHSLSCFRGRKTFRHSELPDPNYAIARTDQRPPPPLPQRNPRLLKQVRNFVIVDSS